MNCSRVWHVANPIDCKRDGIPWPFYDTILDLFERVSTAIWPIRLRSRISLWCLPVAMVFPSFPSNAVNKWPCLSKIWWKPPPLFHLIGIVNKTFWKLYTYLKLSGEHRWGNSNLHQPTIPWAAWDSGGENSYESQAHYSVSVSS